MTAIDIARAQLAHAADRGSSAARAMLAGPVALDVAEACRRDVDAMLGVYPAGVTLVRDACDGCGARVEPDADGPCCGSSLAEDEVFTMPTEVVTTETLTVHQARAVHAQVATLAAPTRSQLMLRAACERYIDGLAERRSVAAMTLEQCRELVAAAWNDATPRMQEVRR
jgi:hypothetical protein